MTKRVAAALTALFLFALILCGCNQKASPDISEGAPSHADQAAPLSPTLTDNRSLTGGPKSGLIDNEDGALSSVPTGRPAGGREYLLLTTSIVFPDDEQGGFTHTDTYTYNESGQLVSVSSNAGVYETLTYNEQGLLLRHVDDDDLYLYNYADDGVLLSVDRYNAKHYPDGNRLDYTVFVYDGSARRESCYDSYDESLEHYSLFINDRLAEYRRYSRYVPMWRFYEYDGNGNLRYVLSADPETGEKEFLYEYIYNEFGVLTEVISYTDGRDDGDRWQCHYNSSGDCIRIDIGYTARDTGEWTLSASLEFVYDENGNLLAEYLFDEDGELATGYYLEYTYAEKP